MNYFRDVQDFVCVELLFLARIVPGTYFRGTPTEYRVSYVGPPDCNILEKFIKIRWRETAWVCSADIL